jgi:glycosidase
LRTLIAISPALVAGMGACAPSRDCAEELWYLESGAAQVSVVGDFNGWNPAADPMETDGEGTWHLSLALPAGDYGYLLSVDGEEVLDPFAPLTRWDGEEEVSLLRVADCAQPALEVVEAGATADGALTVEATWLRSSGGAKLEGAEAALLDGTPLEVTTKRGAISAAVDGLAPGKHTVSLTAWDTDGARAQLRVPLWVEAAPFEWADALVYQIVLDRFADTGGALAPEGFAPDAIGGRFGGDLAGVTAALEAGYFEELGVSALWLSPLYENPEGLWEGLDGQLYESYHGYWPIAAEGVDARWGGEAALRALVDAAHARGVRLILDVVPNHVHEDHPWYSERPELFNDDPDCICGDYSCPWSSDIETCWFTEYLPDLDWTRPEVAQQVVPATVQWALDYDLDGFRVDAVPMMPRAAVRELVAGLSEALENGPTRFYTLGETYTGPDGYADIRTNLGPWGLDGQFEFPTLWALRGWLAWGEGDAADVAEVIARSLETWEGSGSVMAPFVGNHDMSRFISEAAGQDLSSPWGNPPPAPEDAPPYQKLVLAQAVALTLPGAPVLYYGDEIGLPGANDPDCRRPMRFEDQWTDLERWTHERVARLGRARRCSDALRRGDWRPVAAGGDALAYLRDAGDGLPALVVLNAAEETQTISLALPADLALSASRFVDAVEGEAQASLSTARPVDLQLPPLSARVYLPDSLPCLDEVIR